MKNKLLLLLCAFALNISAQEWVAKMQDTSANFYDIKASFDEYWKDKPYERGHGYNAFRRWEWFVAPRVYPSGNMKFSSRAYAYEQFLEFTKGQGQAKPIGPTAATNATVANWTPLGPFGSPAGGDAGRLQVILTKPGDVNTIYCGTAAGGLWISTNGGSSYTTSTDLLPSLGVADIAIHPTSTNIIYIATGDKDAGDTYATGVLKSTDGGATFNSTGLSWTTNMQRRIYRLLLDPVSPNKLLAVTSAGIYKSIDAGVTWNQTSPSYCYDAEFKPGDPNTVYAVTVNSLIKSTDGGATFTNVTIGPNMGSNRLSIAVTAANNSYVYILASASNNSFGGLYRSTNSGSSFTKMSSTPNIFDWSTNGSGAGGQGWYDIAIDASPTNANEIIAGGVNTWRSTNGGSTWSLHTHWTGGGGRPYVHADLHYVYYVTGTTIFLGTDGGIARTTNGGSTYTTINGNMDIAQIYKLGNSSSSASRIVTGHQDNGTNLLNGTSWSEIYGGDGMDCFISWSTNNTIVASYTYGDYKRSTNGGGSWTNIITGLSGTAAWVAPIVQDPITANTYYCGYSSVFKSTNQGTNWSQLGTTVMGTIDEIYVCPSNPNYIYVTTTGSVWKTTNGGTTWQNITSGIPPGGAFTSVTCDNVNPDNVYVTMSGYVAGAKVFGSSNGGLTWTNYSAGLPNIPVNTIIYENSSAQKLYVGTDVGVYYKEASMSSWMFYNNGLPNVVVDQLEIYYPTQKLRAATYGRSVWETSLYSNPTAAPSAYFANNFNAACVNLPFAFSDLSSNNPTSWSWSFPGGSPASSSSQNPNVTYATSGIYTVTLISTNGNGPSTPYATTISVVNTPTVVPLSTTVCLGQNAILTLTTNAATAVWSNGSNALSTSIINPPSSTSLTYTASLGACKINGTATVTVVNPPAMPTVSLIPTGLTTGAAIAYQWQLNGAPILGANSQTYAPVSDGWYSVVVSNANCSSTSGLIYITITNLMDNQNFIEGLSLSPNPTKDFINIVWNNSIKSSMEYEIVNVLGQKVMQGTAASENAQNAKINVQNLTSGTYFVKLSQNKAYSTIKFIKE